MAQDTRRAVAGPGPWGHSRSARPVASSLAPVPRPIGTLDLSCHRPGRLRPTSSRTGEQPSDPVPCTRCPPTTAHRPRCVLRPRREPIVPKIAGGPWDLSKHSLNSGQTTRYLTSERLITSVCERYAVSRGPVRQTDPCQRDDPVTSRTQPWPGSSRVPAGESGVNACFKGWALAASRAGVRRLARDGSTRRSPRRPGWGGSRRCRRPQGSRRGSRARSGSRSLRASPDDRGDALDLVLLALPCAGRPPCTRWRRLGHSPASLGPRAEPRSGIGDLRRRHVAVVPGRLRLNRLGPAQTHHRSSAPCGRHDVISTTEPP